MISILLLWKRLPWRSRLMVVWGQFLSWLGFEVDLIVDERMALHLLRKLKWCAYRIKKKNSQNAEEVLTEINQLTRHIEWKLMNLQSES